MSAIMTDPSNNNVAELFAPGPGERLRAARLSMNYDLAKIASDLEKPDGFVGVEPGHLQKFLAPLPVSRL